MQVLTRTVLEPIPQRLPQRQGRALLSTQPRRRGQILPDPCSPPAVDRCQSPTVAAALDRLAGQPSVRQRPPGSPRTRRCPDRSLRPSVGGSTRVVRRIPPQSACQLYMELSTTPHLPSGAIRTCGSFGRPGDSAPNPAHQPTPSRATRPDVPSTSHLPADLQAVQPEARHTATMEAIDFANFDAAVSTQR